MRLRWRVRSMLISVALVAIGLAAWVALERRSEHFTHLAAYHLQAHGELVDQAGGPLQCLQLEGDEALEAVMEGPSRPEASKNTSPTRPRRTIGIFSRSTATPPRGRGCPSRPTRHPRRWRTPELMLMRVTFKRFGTGTNSFRAASSNGETAVDCVVCWRGSACSTGRLDWPSERRRASAAPRSSSTRRWPDSIGRLESHRVAVARSQGGSHAEPPDVQCFCTC